MVTGLAAELTAEPERKLYVGNLDYRVTEYAVLKRFMPQGKITREQFMFHTSGERRGTPLGHCYIEFSTAAEAAAAAEQLHGSELMGRKMVVRNVSEKLTLKELGGDSGGRALAPSGGVAAAAAAKPGAGARDSKRAQIKSKQARIAAIRRKLEAIETEQQGSAKRSRGGESSGDPR